MSTLSTFAAQKITISKGTEDHDRFLKYLNESFEEMTDATVVVTEGVQMVRVPVIPQGTTEMSITDLPASEITFTIELSAGIFEATAAAFDSAGFLAMSAGRCAGNYLYAQALDTEGPLFVRFGKNMDLTVERTGSSMGAMPSGDTLLAFKFTLYASAARSAV